MDPKIPKRRFPEEKKPKVEVYKGVNIPFSLNKRITLPDMEKLQKLKVCYCKKHKVYYDCEVGCYYCLKEENQE